MKRWAGHTELSGTLCTVCLVDWKEEGGVPGARFIAHTHEGKGKGQRGRGPDEGGRPAAGGGA